MSQRSCRNCNPRQSSAQKTALMQPQCLLGFVVFPKSTHPSLCSSSISLRLRAPRASELPTSLTSRLSRSQNYLSHQASRPQHPGPLPLRLLGAVVSYFRLRSPTPPPPPRLLAESLAFSSNSSTSGLSCSRLYSCLDTLSSDYGDSPLIRLRPQRA